MKRPSSSGSSKHPLKQAVFRSVYNSAEQRRRRVYAAMLLTGKHTLRGLLFSWPLYLMVYAGFRTDIPVNLFLWALGIPGIAISIFILARGVREEYRARVNHKILKCADLMRVFRGDRA